MAPAAEVEAALRERLQATSVSVDDVSDGCGSKLEVSVVSPLFAGKTLLQRHRLVRRGLRVDTSCRPLVFPAPQSITRYTCADT